MPMDLVLVTTCYCPNLGSHAVHALSESHHVKTRREKYCEFTKLFGYKIVVFNPKHHFIMKYVRNASFYQRASILQRKKTI